METIINRLADFVVEISVIAVVSLVGCIITVVKKIWWPKPRVAARIKDYDPYITSYKRCPPYKCMGRSTQIKELRDSISENMKDSTQSKPIIVSGSEGMGKTFFCKTVIETYLESKDVFIAWINANGYQSIFEIINSTFKDKSLKSKNASDILLAFKALIKPCILLLMT